MAVVETIKIEADATDFNQELNKLNSEVDELTAAIEDFGNKAKKGFEKAEKAAEDVGDKAKESSSKIKDMASSVSKLAVGAFALDKLGEAFTGSQVAADFLNTSLNRVKGVVNSLIDLVTGKIKLEDFFGNVAEKVSLADQLVGLEKKSQLAEVERQRIQLKGQKDAEVERQKRDNDLLSIAERQKANERLNAILKQQIKDEKEQIKIQLEYLEAKERLEPITENEVATAQKRVELIDIEERVLSQQSEFLMNRNSLTREGVEISKQQNELDAVALEQNGQLFDAYDAQNKIIAEGFVNARLTRLQQLRFEFDYQTKAYNLRRNFLDKQIEAAKKAGQTENAQYKQMLSERQQLDINYKDFVRENSQETEQVRYDALMANIDLAQQGFAAFTDLLSSLQSDSDQNAEQSFKFNKSLQLANAIVNTAAAVTAQLAVPQDALTGANFVKAGIALTSGLAQVATISKTQFNPSSGGGSYSGPTEVQSPSISPQFNIVGRSGINQLAQSVNARNNQPIQAYVVAGEVTNAQQLARRRARTATFG